MMTMEKIAVRLDVTIDNHQDHEFVCAEVAPALRAFAAALDRERRSLGFGEVVSCGQEFKHDNVTIVAKRIYAGQ